MVTFFKCTDRYIMIKATKEFSPLDIEKLIWLFGNAEWIKKNEIKGYFAGPRKEMVTPWSTNAVEITQNMGIEGIERMEEFFEVTSMQARHDPMLQRIYNHLTQDIFTIVKPPDPILYIDDISGYNQKEGLALSPEEINYLEALSKKLNRKLTDSEIFGFSQVNSEHCRHKIFNGTFIIDGEEKKVRCSSL